MEIFRDYIIQSPLTVSVLKSKKVIEVSIFHREDNIRLKYLLEILSCLHDWYKYVRDLPINNQNCITDLCNSSNSLNDNKDTISVFIDDDEIAENSNIASKE